MPDEHPIDAILNRLRGGPPAKQCGEVFNSRDANCNTTARHHCALTVPHIGHECSCGAKSLRTF